MACKWSEKEVKQNSERHQLFSLNHLSRSIIYAQQSTFILSTHVNDFDVPIFSFNQHATQGAEITQFCAGSDLQVLMIQFLGILDEIQPLVKNYMIFCLLFSSVDYGWGGVEGWGEKAYNCN